VVFNLPQTSLELTVKADGKEYQLAKQIGGLDRSIGETAYRTDFPVKMLESGSIFQRVMIMNLRFVDEQGAMLKADKAVR
jgi:hypothetical protein